MTTLKIVCVAFLATSMGQAIALDRSQTIKTKDGVVQGTVSDEVMGLGDHPGVRPAVSSTDRRALFKDHAAHGGQLSLC